ncbi:MAG: ROK family transcriptional regulator, partial [Candidatus Delongbacteria bacterium]|nr:ROK family transcriptional regulator [Candidatus Delongbacteria bacterium]
MYISGNIRLLKNLNQQHVLNIIRMNPGITAPEISRRTRLQISTVSYILKELNQWNLIQKNGVGQSTVQGGKKPVLWDLQPQYGYILGLEIKPLEIRLVLIDFKGSVLYKKRFVTEFTQLNPVTIETIHQIIQQVIREKSLETQNILGMGIGISGMIDDEEGRIIFSGAFGIKNYPFKHQMQAHYSFPVEIVNDANAGALCIKWY